MSRDSRTFTYDVAPPVAGTVVPNLLATSDFVACEGNVNELSGTLTMGTGDSTTQYGSIDVNYLLGTKTFEVEVDGTNAQSLNAQGRIGVRSDVTCGASGTANTRFVVLVPFNGSNGIVQLQVGGGAVTSSSSVSGTNVRSKWKIVLSGTAPARNVTVSRANWNGASFDAFTTILNHSESALGETWADSAFTNLNVVLEFAQANGSDTMVFREMNP